MASTHQLVAILRCNGAVVRLGDDIDFQVLSCDERCDEGDRGCEGSQESHVERMAFLLVGNAYGGKASLTSVEANGQRDDAMSSGTEVGTHMKQNKHVGKPRFLDTGCKYIARHCANARPHSSIVQDVRL